jgi:hypothetical protein
MTTKSGALAGGNTEKKEFTIPRFIYTLALTINPDVQTVHPLCIRTYFGAKTLTVFITSFIALYPWSYTSLGTW